MSELIKVKGAWPYFVAIFLNAFVDLGHKIVIQNTIFKIYDGSTQILLTAIVNALILLPFILLLTPAGDLSDKFPKNIIARYSAVAVVVMTILITLCYWLGWFWPAFALTFLLAIQSAFFSPAKYGYIKILFGKVRLSQANGIAQALAIIAILLGTFSFTVLFEWLYSGNAQTKQQVLVEVAPVGLLLILAALIEMIAAMKLPTLEKTQIHLKLSLRRWLSPASLIGHAPRVLRRDELAYPIIGATLFWSVGQVLLAVYPAYAKVNLAITNTVIIQGILASSGIGIGLGAALISFKSRGYIEMAFIPVGILGLIIGLLSLPYAGSAIQAASLLLMIGFMGGLYVVPLMSIIQFNAAQNELGRVISVSNWAQNTAMLILLMLTVAAAAANISPNYLLSSTVVVVIVLGSYTLFNIPQGLLRAWLLVTTPRARTIQIQGVGLIPEQGAVFIKSLTKAPTDMIILQSLSPRPLSIIIKADQSKASSRFAGVEQCASNEQLIALVQAKLAAGEMVCCNDYPEEHLPNTVDILSINIDDSGPKPQMIVLNN